MSYTTRKDFRNPKRGAKLISSHCQNNGTCDYCRSNRTYKNLKRIQSVKEIEKEFS